LDYKGRSFDAAWLLKFVYTTFEHSTHKKLDLPEKPGWRVFGSVQAEGFDPLAFSKKVGDYRLSSHWYEHWREVEGFRCGVP
jgi:hypothetical protein